MIKEKVHAYLSINNHKLTDVSNDEYISNAIRINELVFNDSEVYTTTSTDVFPQAIKINNQNVTLFSVNYIQYVEHLYSNIRLLLILKDNQQDCIDKIYKNITSDACHLLSSLNYNSKQKADKYLNKAKELFDNPNIYREIDAVDEYFFLAKNLFILRHEANHNNHAISKYKPGLNESLRIALKNINNTREKSINRQHLKLADNSILIDTINSILKEEDNSPLYIELLCDYAAFMNSVIVFEAIESQFSLEERMDLLHMSISIFNIISDFLRRISSLDQQNTNANALIRPSINGYINTLILINFFKSRNINSDCLLNSPTHHFTDGTQDIYLDELTKILIYLKELNI